MNQTHLDIALSFKREVRKDLQEITEAALKFAENPRTIKDHLRASHGLQSTILLHQRLMLDMFATYLEWEAVK